MIRVIIERHAKDGIHLLTLLREIRAEAMEQLGYISGETLVDIEDSSIIIVISTWESLKSWKNWHFSEVRANLDQKIESQLVEPTKIRTFRYLSYRRATGQA
ncbi:antibiotic biosynthesis monooxygenase family protein [Chloroflexota bacterium]